MTHFTQADLDQLRDKGISIDVVETQLDRFRTGFPYLKILAPASPGTGMVALSDDERSQCLDRWNDYLANNGEVLKFVPASGAASRMFKALFAFVNGEESEPKAGSPVAELKENIASFAFYNQLCQTTNALYGKTPEQLIEEGRSKDVVAAIILPDGMNYGALPKALLTFHRYADGTTRTALEEQLAEGAQMAASAGKVKLHFTVSSNHRKLFEAKLAEAVPAMEERFGVKYEISLSEQKPSTDTIAVTPDNELFRDDNGRLVFRPGGHGALIENLNDVNGTVVFIKNIDNIVADSHREPTIENKKLLGGLLLSVQGRIADFAKRLKDAADKTVVDEAIDFCRSVLFVGSAAFDTDDDQARRTALLTIFDRPVRVCGMVRNEGEPGGGPYVAMSSDGKLSAPQILESTQIDLSKPENAEMMKGAGYFNPVDLVCYLRRPDGTSYYLPDYVDPATGFISEKSLGGRDLRALELPGLWNGAMSNWNTVFVEVPAATFNPVKTVNDLLRPAHQ